MARARIAPGVVVACVLIAQAAKGQCEGQWLDTGGAGSLGVGGNVHAIIEWDPDGPGPEPLLTIVGGEFTQAGSVEANHVAAWDGSAWRALGEGVDGPVRALAVHEGQLIVGGSFTHAGGSPSPRVARWDASQWHSMGDGPPGDVHALLVYNSELAAGGESTLHRWTGSDWKAWGGGVPAGSGVFAMAAYKNDLVVAGRFSTVGGVLANSIARWDGTGWYALGAGLGADVLTLAVNGDALCAGGSFTKSAGSPSDSLAIWTGTEWLPALGFPAIGITGVVRAAVWHDGDLLLGGEFSTASYTNKYLATYPQWYNAAPGQPDGPVHAMLVTTERLVIGGDFSNVGNVEAPHAAERIEASSKWVPLGITLGGPTRAALSHEGKLLVGGSFTHYRGVATANAASWNGTDWSPLKQGTDAWILTLCPFGTDVLVGGWFYNAGGAPMTHIARWDDENWQPMGSGVAAEIVTATPFLDSVVAAGFGGGWESTPVYNWKDNAWHILGYFGVPHFTGFVYAMVEHENQLIVGGSFVTPHWNIARFSGGAWHAMGTQMFSYCRALTVHEGALYAAFGATGVHVWDKSAQTWKPVGTGASDPVPAAWVFALASYRGDLIAAGSFSAMSGVVASNIARWDGSLWSPLGLGVDGSVFDLEVHNDELIVVGDFKNAGGLPSPFFARWTDRPVPWFALPPQDSGPLEPGDSARFDARAALGYDVAYLWQVLAGDWCDLEDGVGGGCLASKALVSGAHTPSLALDGVDLASRGQYRCVISNACETVASEPAALIVACYADCDENAVVDVMDYLCFLDAYSGQNTYADCESDADLDLFDFLCFQQAFAGGCG